VTGNHTAYFPQNNENTLTKTHFAVYTQELR
jgi:hypothetical protein